MKTLKKIKYKGVEFELYTHEMHDEFYFGTSCNGISSKGNATHINRGWQTSSEAIKDMEEGIDAFLAIAPKTYKELADAITGSLVWTGYEDCHADEFIIKTLVENFLKVNNDLKKV
jgi:hypothetical protein